MVPLTCHFPLYIRNSCTLLRDLVFILSECVINGVLNILFFFFYLWEVMHNATCESTFSTAANENPFLKKSQALMNAGMCYSLQTLF